MSRTFQLAGFIVLLLGLGILAFAMRRVPSTETPSASDIVVRGGSEPHSVTAREADGGQPVADRADAIEARWAIGRLVWSDGVPVVGAKVTSATGGTSAISGRDGAFRLEVSSGPYLSTIQLAVQPGCWRAPAHLGSEAPLVRRESAAVPVLDYEIPAQADVELRISIDAGAVAILDRVGFESIHGVVFARDDLDPGVHNEVSEFFRKRTVLGRASMPLASAPQISVMRVPLRPLVECYGEVVPPEKQGKLGSVTTPTVSINLDRMSVRQVDLQVDSGALIAGRVVTQDGQPIAGCTVAVPRLESGRLGPRRVSTNDDGCFVTSGSPGDTYVVWADYQGAESERMQVAVGNVDIQLQCSTANLRRIVVNRGAEPLERFELATHSSVFGRYTLPWLPLRRGGVTWLPSRVEAEPRYLCWHDGRAFQEVPVMVPGVREAPEFAIDVATLSPEPMGLLYVDNAPDGPTIRLTRVSPDPPPGFRRQGAAALPWKAAPLLGILAGTYEVRVGTNPLEPPVATVRVDLVAGENRLRVADLLRGR